MGAPGTRGMGVLTGGFLLSPPGTLGGAGGRRGLQAPLCPCVSPSRDGGVCVVSQAAPHHQPHGDTTSPMVTPPGRGVVGIGGLGGQRVPWAPAGAPSGHLEAGTGGDPTSLPSGCLGCPSAPLAGCWVHGPSVAAGGGGMRGAGGCSSAHLEEPETGGRGTGRGTGAGGGPGRAPGVPVQPGARLRAAVLPPRRYK